MKSDLPNDACPPSPPDRPTPRACPARRKTTDLSTGGQRQSHAGIVERLLGFVDSDVGWLVNGARRLQSYELMLWHAMAEAVDALTAFMRPQRYG